MSTTRAKGHERKANGKGMRSVDDRRTRRRDEEVIVKLISVYIGHQRESAPRRGKDLHVQVFITRSRDIDT
jgi:hypothetical protein